MQSLMVVTTERIPGYEITQVHGAVYGVVVRSRGIGGDIMASLRSVVGGEIHEYTQMLEQARQHALDRMIEHASSLGANAVVMIRFDSSEIGKTMSEIVAYGTAVTIRRQTA
ncbi:MAG TPA: YbjQ family protein [Thermomicrobiaceae bacterium]|nr:YbjQ family protein [Thermomicrobiaceae bacterium]